MSKEQLNTVCVTQNGNEIILKGQQTKKSLNKKTP